MTGTKQAGQTFQSFNWLRGVAEDKAITIVHRLVLVRLALHRRNSDGRCAPGLDDLAAELGVGRASVYRAVAVGIRRGWLMRSAAHSGRFLKNFELTFPGQPSHQGDGSERPTVSPVRLNRLTSETQPSQGKSEAFDLAGKFGPNGSLNGRRERGKYKNPSPRSIDGSKKAAGEGSKNQTRNRATGADAGAAFGRFWAAYPRRAGKLDAERAFLAAIEAGADPEALIAGAQRYALERAGEDSTFTKYPARWLQAGSWTDEPASSGAPTIDNITGDILDEQPQHNGQHNGHRYRRHREDETEDEFVARFMAEYEAGR